MRHYLVILIVLGLFALTACGQTGRLYLPDEPAENQFLAVTGTVS